jgi:hypothetical protein
MGGGQVSGDVKHFAGAIKPEYVNGNLIGLKYDFERGKRERLDPGDRIHVILRSAFILDECCQPIDGAHVGGWAPFVQLEGDDPDHHPKSPIKIPKECRERIGTFAHWRSGTGSPGGNFESWFSVSESPDQGQHS